MRKSINWEGQAGYVKELGLFCIIRGGIIIGTSLEASVVWALCMHRGRLLFWSIMSYLALFGLSAVP